MGILDIPTKTRKASNREITKYFLKKHGFYVDRWGSPYDREKETSVFYEALYADSIGIVRGGVAVYSIQATIKYFPKEFDGYTTIGKTWGHGNVAGKLVITYEDRTCWEHSNEYGFTDTMIFDCKTHADFYDAIDCFNIDLMQKDYEPIRY